MPFFEALGYDTRNPFEFVPEFTADIADSKGEKVDYGIFINDKVEFIVECKNWKEDLSNHDKQLNRYFNVVDSHIGILTNGIHYKFFTDLEEPNKMDKNPFYEFNILDINEYFNDLLRDKLKTAFQFKVETQQDEIIETFEEIVDNKVPVTTEEEISGFSIVKSMLLDVVLEIDKITFKDTLSYFNILFEDNTRKWICKLYFNSQNKYISFPVLENGERTLKEEKIPLENIFEISKYKHRIEEIVKLYV